MLQYKTIKLYCITTLLNYNTITQYWTILYYNTITLCFNTTLVNCIAIPQHCLIWNTTLLTNIAIPHYNVHEYHTTLLWCKATLIFYLLRNRILVEKIFLHLKFIIYITWQKTLRKYDNPALATLALSYYKDTKFYF